MKLSMRISCGCGKTWEVAPKIVVGVAQDVDEQLEGVLWNVEAALRPAMIHAIENKHTVEIRGDIRVEKQKIYIPPVDARARYMERKY